jgi:primosomal protein N' (replication factor Y)
VPDVTPAASSDQLELIGSRHPGGPAERKTAPQAGADVAEEGPVAAVSVDSGLAHLDRPFEYLVPASMAQAAGPGVRVKVRFAGRDLDGFVLERRDAASHAGRLTPLRRVVSPEPVLTPAVLAAAREVAERYAGSLSDVLRLAVPARHARAEAALPVTAAEADPQGQPVPATAAAWARYRAGTPFLGRLRAGEAPAASWLAAPTSDPALDWPVALAEAAAATLASGRGALIVLPDHRDVARVDSALGQVLGRGRHVRLTADQGPQARYTAWLSVLRGRSPVVVGTRAAAFAPVRRLGLVAWWDDGDDLHEEPRAPYPHVREILAARARHESAALLSGGFTRTTAMQAWLEADAVKAIAAPATLLRAAAPRVSVAGEGAEVERDPAAASARLPSLALRTAREALFLGPVLVQVPRRGYLPGLACQACRARARCEACHGPVALAGPHAPPACRWCGRPCAPFRCPQCGGTRLRSSSVGARRTAEEIGRAFPGVPVRTSGSGEVLERVAAGPALVIATPGAEPVAEEGYAAALLLDAWALLDRPVLTAGEEALRRWTTAAALTRGASDGGAVVVCGAPAHAAVPPVEALVRWDPAWFARRELAERAPLALPPTVRIAQLTAPARTLGEALETLDLPEDVAVLGPLPVDDDLARALLRAPLHRSAELSRSLAALRALRSARKEPVTVHVRVDPADLGV